MSGSLGGSDASHAIARGAVELYMRPSHREGIWMICGYGAIRSPEDPELISVWDRQLENGQFAIRSSRSVPEDDWNGTRVTDHANLVTKPIWWLHAQPSSPVMQLAQRRVDGVSGVSLLAGLLQDDTGLVTRHWDRQYGVMLKGRVGSGRMDLIPAAVDLSWTAGISLGQVQKAPVWSLGAEEPWAAQWTMAPAETRAARRAAELRRMMLLGTATAEDETEFEHQRLRCGLAVQKPGTDPNFETCLRHLYATEDGIWEQAALVTASESRRREQAMEHAIRQELAGEPSL